MLAETIIVAALLLWDEEISSFIQFGIALRDRVSLGKGPASVGWRLEWGQDQQFRPESAAFCSSNFAACK